MIGDCAHEDGLSKPSQARGTMRLRMPFRERCEPLASRFVASKHGGSSKPGGGRNDSVGEGNASSWTLRGDSGSSESLPALTTSRVSQVLTEPMSSLCVRAKLTLFDCFSCGMVVDGSQRVFTARPSAIAQRQSSMTPKESPDKSSNRREPLLIGLQAARIGRKSPKNDAKRQELSGPTLVSTPRVRQNMVRSTLGRVAPTSQAGGHAIQEPHESMISPIVTLPAKHNLRW